MLKKQSGGSIWFKVNVSQLESRQWKNENKTENNENCFVLFSDAHYLFMEK